MTYFLFSTLCSYAFVAPPFFLFEMDYAPLERPEYAELKRVGTGGIRHVKGSTGTLMWNFEWVSPPREPIKDQ